MNNCKKVIVVHPGKQHSYKLAEALKSEDMLMYYVTTVYDKKFSWTHLLGSFLTGDNKKRFLTRKSEVFDDAVVQFCEMEGLFLLFLYRKAPNSGITNYIENHIHKKVYKKTIKLAARRGADAIVFYDKLSEEHFALREKICPDIKFIIDVACATDQYMRKVFEKDVEITGDDYLKIERQTIWTEGGKATIPVRNKLADGFLVASSFVEKSLIDYKAEVSKIRVVPYGVDTSMFSLKTFKDAYCKVKFIFVGRLNRHKGIQHLLPAFEKIDPRKAELILVGQYDDNDVLIKKYQNFSNIKFRGFVTQDIVAKLYKAADVFVLPSLGDAMAQVGIEAMSCGLPIIVSDNTGVKDLITNGEEGFVVPVSNTDALYKKMEWFVDHPNKINTMGMNARKIAEKYTWNYYKQNVVKAINEILLDKQ